MQGETAGQVSDAAQHLHSRAAPIIVRPIIVSPIIVSQGQRADKWSPGSTSKSGGSPTPTLGYARSHSTRPIRGQVRERLDRYQMVGRSANEAAPTEVVLGEWPFDVEETRSLVKR